MEVLGAFLLYIFFLLLLRYPVQWYFGIASLHRELEMTREQLEIIQRRLAQLPEQNNRED